MENVQNAIISLLMDRLQRKFDGQNSSCSQHWKCSNSSYDGTDLYVSWAVASRVSNTYAANRPADSQYGPRGRPLSGPLYILSPLPLPYLHLTLRPTLPSFYFLRSHTIPLLSPPLPSYYFTPLPSLRSRPLKSS